ncbi:MAG: TonB-dependent receptor [Sphingomonadales bacterium]|nr:TonB-dependent receptor [Sphingomonadales bacterium]
MILNKNLLRAAFIGGVSSVAIASAAIAGETAEFDISAGGLHEALAAYIEQSGEQIIYRIDHVRGVRTKGVNGRYDAREALEILLSETGFDIRRDPSGAAVVVKESEPEKASQVEISETRLAQADQAIARTVDAQSDAVDEDEEEEREQIVVTGTRLIGGDPTQRLTVMDADQIRATGASTVEDIFRNLQQNFSSLNAVTNLQSAGLEELQLGDIPDGIASINLRGLGSENTLVLVNGRRIAGVAGNDNNFANIANIPASAISRIEVLLDGASAIYGSDAIGGVVNIILQKNYSGLEATGRYEHSSTDSDAYRANILAGIGWKGGRITVTGAYNKIDPIRSAEAGYTTNFYPGLDDGEDVDFRRDDLGPTGVVTGFPRLPPLVASALPGDNDGTNALPADFQPLASLGFEPIDLVPEFINPEEERISFTVNAEQELTKRFRLFADFFWSQNETFRRTIPQFIGGVTVPAANAFNNFTTSFAGIDFPIPVRVSYLPLQELADGLIALPEFETRQRQLNVNGGFEYQIIDALQFSVTGSYSRSSSTGENRNVFDRRNPNLNALLSDSDPTTAPNLFGNGTAQNPSFADLFGVTLTQSPISEVISVEPIVRGEAFTLPGGDIEFVAGGEYREERLANSSLLQTNSGVRDNTREAIAYFAEVSIPFFGAPNARPGLRSLVLSTQVRYDKYKLVGPQGFNDEGEPNDIRREFSQFSPRVGLSYSPMEGLVFRGAWGRAFRAPNISQLFQTRSGFFPGLPIFDALNPTGPQFVFIDFGLATANPDLQPETADNYSIGVQYEPSFLDGLTIGVAWSRVKFQDRITNALFVQSILPPEEFAALPGVFTRDENGFATAFNPINVNLESRVSETLDVRAIYQFDTAHGSFDVGFEGSFVLELFDQMTASTDQVSLVGTSRGPVEYLLRGILGWSNGHYGADMFINHTPSHINDISQFADPITGQILRREIDVSSYTTVDLSAHYRFENIGLRITAGARNVFNADFPLSPNLRGSFDASRVDPRGRVAFIEVTKSL